MREQVDAPVAEEAPQLLASTLNVGVQATLEIERQLDDLLGVRKLDGAGERSLQTCQRPGLRRGLQLESRQPRGHCLRPSTGGDEVDQISDLAVDLLEVSASLSDLVAIVAREHSQPFRESLARACDAVLGAETSPKLIE